ncbi:MAG TPA: Ig-like domain-containing protein, partial [Candidatus Hydrogenedentes bacterium]|nr:Ig-like domain-containing protein [Candidatus Hydrogenedentota bacterium]
MITSTLRVSLFLLVAGSVFGAMTGCKPVVTVTPAFVTIKIGESVTLQASSTSSQDTAFVWAATNVAIATVDQTGTVMGNGIGQTVVTARGASSGSEGTATITVE